MTYDMVFDNFPDVYAFREAIQTRKDNRKCDGSARTNDRDFAGMPLDEAYNALTDGLPEVVERLKRDLVKLQCKTAGNLNQRRPINYYNGHSPNVPAAIMGLPKSMRKNVRTPSKVKTVALFFNSWICCAVNANDFEKAGSAVYQLVYYLEKCGYRVRLTVIPVCCEDNSDGDNNAVCAILLKDFRQPLDMLKLSFSLTSISMWRRLGFKWIETVPGLKHSWRHYGRKVNKAKAMGLIKQAGHDLENGYFIDFDTCNEANFDCIELAKKLGIEV